MEGSHEEKIVRRNQQPIVEASLDDDGKPLSRKYTMQGIVLESPSIDNTETEAIANVEETIVSPSSASQTWKTAVKASLNESWYTASNKLFHKGHVVSTRQVLDTQE